MAESSRVVGKVTSPFDKGAHDYVIRNPQLISLVPILRIILTHFTSFDIHVESIVVNTVF